MGTHHRGTPQEVLALDAFIKLKRAVSALQGQLSDSISAYNLTESQFGTLEVLYHLGPLCQRALGEKLLTSGGNMTLVIDNLEKRGLVQRVRSVEDRRFISVYLTDEGQVLMQKVFPQHALRVAACMGVLSAEEQAELGRLCKKLGLAMKAPAEQVL